MGVYNPDQGVLISRKSVGNELKEELKNVMVIDDVEFNYNKLEELTNSMVKGVGISLDIKDLGYKYAIENIDDFRKWLREKIGIEINKEMLNF